VCEKENEEVGIGQWHSSRQTMWCGAVVAGVIADDKSDILDEVCVWVSEGVWVCVVLMKEERRLE
jgi:hypothetical protein